MRERARKYNLIHIPIKQFTTMFLSLIILSKCLKFIVSLFRKLHVLLRILLSGSEINLS